MDAAIKSIKDGTYDECLASMKSIFQELDLNNDGYIDRCEDSKFLMSVNNGNLEYSRNFAGEISLPGLQDYCKWFVLDAFDYQQQNQVSLIDEVWKQLTGIFPINMDDMDGKHH